MRHLLVVLTLLLGACAATAADMRVAGPDAKAPPQVWRYDRHGDMLPFPRSGRSQAVYAADACWTGCQSYCTWSEAACFKVDAQGRCLRATDRCDRYCQSECRTRGGPLLSFDLLLRD